MNLRILIFPLMLFLVACGSDRAAEMADREPVQFIGKQPAQMPVQGIDVSRFQDTIDWREAKSAGVKFAFLKATEGGDIVDPMFRAHWRGADRANIRRGAYHFYYFCTDPEVQARWFIRNVPKDRGALPPVLDMEWNPLSPTCQRRPTGTVVRREMKVFLDIVEQHFGQRPIIYTTPQFYRDAGLSAMRWEEFWLRSTADALHLVYPGQPWRFWQYSATGVVPGAQGDVDLNAFNGTQLDWETWLAQRTR